MVRCGRRRKRGFGEIGARGQRRTGFVWRRRGGFDGILGGEKGVQKGSGKIPCPESGQLHRGLRDKM